MYQNFEIFICKEQNSWFAYCDQFPTCPEKLIQKILSKGISPKEVFETAKMEIELYEMKMLKRKMDKSVAEILKSDWRNTRHNQI